MPAATQAKLLRVLEDRKLRRLGSKVETPVDVRVVAATNKDPEQAVANGDLRGDLYYRLNVFNIQMPPLREHVSDVTAIAEKMIADMNERHGCSVTGLKDSLLKRMLEYSWPGNVRELRNTMERAVSFWRAGASSRTYSPARSRAGVCLVMCARAGGLRFQRWPRQRRRLRVHRVRCSVISRIATRCMLHGDNSG